MIFSKRVNIINTVITIMLCTVCLVMAVDVNTRFPNASVVTNDKDNAIIWRGFKVKALEKTVYTAEAYLETYPNDMFHGYYAQRQDNTNRGVIVYRVEVENFNNYTAKFSLSGNADAAAFPSAWSNGVMPLSEDVTLKPGERAVLEGAADYTPTLVHDSERDTFKDNEFQLIFSYYPERIVLKFD